MVHTELLRDEGILILKPEGKLEAADFENISKLVDPYIQEHNSLNGLMIEAKEFPGWNDFAALLSHIRFVKDHHKLIEKIAMVSDNSFLSKAPEVAKHFVHAKVQHFESSKRAEALAWLGLRDATKRPEQTL